MNEAHDRQQQQKVTKNHFFLIEKELNHIDGSILMVLLAIVRLIH